MLSMSSCYPVPTTRNCPFTFASARRFIFGSAEDLRNFLAALPAMNTQAIFSGPATEPRSPPAQFQAPGDLLSTSPNLLPDYCTIIS